MSMAVQRPSVPLSDLLGGPELNPRHENWLWLHLNRNGAALDPNEFKGHAMRDRMAEYILKSGMPKELTHAERSRTLLPEDCLQWITSDPRQLNWLTMKIQGSSVFAYTSPPPRLLGREFVVAMIDLDASDISAKKAALQSLESAWVSHRQQDHIFKWFQDSKNGPQRCTLAWERLSKNSPILTLGKVPFEDYNGLLDFFDQAPMGEADKKLFVLDIKKRWSQQRYREKQVGKKQYNFVLSDKANRHLDSLAKTYDLKRNQVLEILIQVEANGGSYIAEQLKALRSL